MLRDFNAPRAKSGTREWSEHSFNIQTGCSNSCRYCFARADALRFKKIANPKEWAKETLTSNAYITSYPKRSGVIMFPTTHDITPFNLEVYLRAANLILKSGNKVLIVTKPRYEVIKYLCKELQKYRRQIVFRFSIGSMSNEILSFWEPGAPSYDERYESLWTAYASGFETSVSCEPYLDNKIYDLVMAVSSLVTDSIWIGKMNRISNRVNTDGWSSKERSFLHRVFDAQTNEFIKDLYGRLKDKPQVRWKDSIKKVLGLPEEEIG